MTYDDKHIPINPETMRLTLDKTEIPRYMKRLRKLHSKAYRIMKKKDGINAKDRPRLKYYAVGEYGEEVERPHYHMILFNAIKELIPLSWSINKEMLGMIQIGEKGVTAGGAIYLCQYMLTGQDGNYEHKQKPFSLMSKNLGDNYVTEEMKRWHLEKTGKAIVTAKGKIIKTRDRYYAIQDGYKIALPRYYRDKIFPKIYREIDIPIIVNEHIIEELKEAEKDFMAYARNQEGLRQTGESIKLKKIKQKKRFKQIQAMP